MRVSDILSQKQISGVSTIRRRETMKQLSKQLSEMRVGALVVFDESDKMVGVISERDVVGALSAGGEVALKDAVEKHMTADVVTTEPTETAESVLEKMTNGRFRHMPVLDNGELVGVVSIGDIVKARIELLQREKEAMEAFIQS